MARYDEVNIASDVSSISMSINKPSCNSYQYNNFQPKVDSNPIAPRGRKRQRLPPNLLIENASDRDPARAKVYAEASPIKASGNTETEKR